MGVLVGIDLGEKRVGLAQSDETATIAESVATLTFKSKADLLRQLSDYIAKVRPEKIVVGYPETLKGESGFAAQKVLVMVEWLKSRIAGDWVLWDERFSTVEAERVLLEADLSREKRRRLRDQLAAQRILQSYLNSTTQ